MHTGGRAPGSIAGCRLQVAGCRHLVQDVSGAQAAGAADARAAAKRTKGQVSQPQNRQRVYAKQRDRAMRVGGRDRTRAPLTTLVREQVPRKHTTTTASAGLQPTRHLASCCGPNSCVWCVSPYRPSAVASVTSSGGRPPSG